MVDDEGQTNEPNVTAVTLESGQTMTGDVVKAEPFDAIDIDVADLFEDAPASEK